MTSARAWTISRRNGPAGCVSEPNALHCSDGLKGTFSIDGVGKTYSAALVKVHWFDGTSSVYTLSAGQPNVQLYGSADDHRGRGEIASVYTVLGIEHILSGYDHLLFVFGLLFLVGFRRKLLWTITAFTAAHSLTLASAAMGWLTLRSPPVEATIALSIVLVAAEALNPRMTLARRWPALLAFLFGLVHGLGFAGALKEIGLPQKLSTDRAAHVQRRSRDRSAHDGGGGRARVARATALAAVRTRPHTGVVWNWIRGGVLVLPAHRRDPGLRGRRCCADI
ncbi:MAG: HupE/UreJ family protein [Gammaproteobacteria bacterium]